MKVRPFIKDNQTEYMGLQLIIGVIASLYAGKFLEAQMTTSYAERGFPTAGLVSVFLFAVSIMLFVTVPIKFMSVSGWHIIPYLVVAVIVTVILGGMSLIWNIQKDERD